MWAACSTLWLALGLRQRVRFEGQAAMELEFASEGILTDEAYPLDLIAAPPRLPPSADSLPSCPQADPIVTRRSLTGPRS